MRGSRTYYVLCSFIYWNGENIKEMILQVRKIQINAVLILSWVHESPHWGIKQNRSQTMSQNMNKIVQGIIPSKYDQEEKWKEGAMKKKEEQKLAKWWEEMKRVYTKNWSIKRDTWTKLGPCSITAAQAARERRRENKKSLDMRKWRNVSRRIELKKRIANKSKIGSERSKHNAKCKMDGSSTTPRGTRWDGKESE